MAEVLLFHHAHGRTNGVLSFADTLTQAGHVVHVPDLYEGRVFEKLEAGLAYAQDTGFGTILERGRAASDGLPNWSRRRPTLSCSSTRVTSTSSPTPACRPTTKPRRA